MKIFRRQVLSLQFFSGTLLGLIIAVILMEFYPPRRFFSTEECLNMCPKLEVTDVAENETNSLEEIGTRAVIYEEADYPTQSSVRLLCWILTCPKNHLTKAVHVNRTWGRRCDKLLFMSTESDAHLDVIALPNVKESRDGLWGKTQAALKYIWDHHRNDADWFFKADDDTYTVVENLKKLLDRHAHSDPVIFGGHHKYRPRKSEWVTGGSGYVLSKETLKRFVTKVLPNTSKCDQEVKGGEDIQLSHCLLNIAGVKIVDSRDPFGRHRFLHFTPQFHVFPRTKNETNKYWHMLAHPLSQGMDCCADDAISFHYIPPEDMYVMDYLLYHLRPDGVLQEDQYTQIYPLEFNLTKINSHNPLTSKTKPVKKKPRSS